MITPPRLAIMDYMIVAGSDASSAMRRAAVNAIRASQKILRRCVSTATGQFVRGSGLSENMASNQYEIAKAVRLATEKRTRLKRVC